jgi:hypothetical protein
MARVLDLKIRKNSGASPSILNMEHNNEWYRAAILVASSVLPGAVVWIFFDSLIAGVVLGAIAFVLVEFTLPALKNGELSVAHLLRTVTNIHESVRDRVLRRA